MKIKKAAVVLAAAVMAMGSCADEKSAQTEVMAHTDAALTEVSGETGSQPLEKYIITCDELAERVMNGGSAGFPHHMAVTDETMMTDVIGYDMSITEDHSVNIQLVSADLFELTVIRASDENGEAVLKMLNERKDYLKERAAAYPAQVEAANATIVSHTGDIYYLICHKDAVSIEKALITEIKYN